MLTQITETKISSQFDLEKSHFSVPKVKAKLQDGGVEGGGAVKTPPIVKRFIQIYSGYL
jgi:hypothetical protein